MQKLFQCTFIKPSNSKYTWRCLCIKHTINRRSIYNNKIFYNFGGLKSPFNFQQLLVEIKKSKIQPKVQDSQQLIQLTNLCKKYIMTKQFDSAFQASVEALQQDPQCSKMIQLRYFQAMIRQNQEQKQDCIQICVETIENFLNRKKNKQGNLSDIYESYEYLLNLFEYLQHIDQGLKISNLKKQIQLFFDCFKSYQDAYNSWNGRFKDLVKADQNFQNVVLNISYLQEYDTQIYMAFLTNYAQFYQEKGDFLQGSNGLIKSIQLLQEEGNEEFMFEIYAYINYFYMQLGNSQLCDEYGRKALVLSIKLDQQCIKLQLAAIYSNLAVSSLNLNKIQEAIEFSENSLELSKQINNPEVVKQIISIKNKIDQQISL